MTSPVVFASSGPATVRLVTAVIVAVVAATPAQADELHGANFRFGQRAMAMGGAVIGQVVEPTASYYNPGGLGFLTGAVFSGSVQFHGFDQRQLIGGALAPGFTAQDATSESFLALPSSSVVTHELAGGRHRFAYSTFLLSTTEERFDGRFKDRFDVDASTVADRNIATTRKLRDRILPCLASPSVAPKGILKYDNYCDVLKCRTTYIMSSWTSVPGA